MPNASSNTIFKIQKGIPKVPGDSRSAEQGLDSVNLLDPQGLICDTYDKKVPSLKSGAVWADSSLANGRIPVSMVDSNITETIRLNLSASVMIQQAATLSKLLRFREDCRNFWVSQMQIDPVYIVHQVSGEPAERYALLYDIDISIDPPAFDSAEAIYTVTVVIEREAGWRTIPPGANPKMWTRLFLDNNLQRWNTTTSDLIATTDHLVSSTQVYNSIEWNTATAIRKANYIDIPADKIPGDMPALCYIMLDIPSGGNLYKVMFARSTKPTSVTLRNGNSALQYYNLAAAHCTSGNLGTDATLENDTGAVLYPPASGNARRVKVTFTTSAADVSRISWTDSTSSFTAPDMDENMFRGTFAAFLRCRQVGGAANDVSMHLRYGNVQNVGDILIDTSPVVPTIQAGTGNTTDWPVSYMGVLTIPAQSSPVAISADGRGIAAPVDAADNGFKIELFASRPGGSTANLYICDLVLIPIDECAELISVENGTSGTAANGIFCDTTGYFSRCRDDNFTGRIHYETGGGTNAATLKNAIPSGHPITLEPGKNNRIYVLIFDDTNLSAIDTTKVSGVYVDIVPRWQAYRAS